MRQLTFYLLLAITIISRQSASGAEEDEKNAYVAYGYGQVINTSVLHKTINIDIYLQYGPMVGYRYEERVTGSKVPVTKTIKFANEYVKITSEQRSDLCAQLLSARVFDLPKLVESPDASAGNIDVRLGKRERQLYLSKDQKSIGEIMTGFAHKLGLDYPNDLKAATSMTESDDLAPQKTTLTSVLQNPDAFNGKRVSLVGFYHGEFEGSNFGVKADSDYHESIWFGSPSSFANKADIHLRNNSWLRVEGIFVKGPGGHMGMWPGEIERITRVDSAPEDSSH
jgi:hypothetical protein